MSGGITMNDMLNSTQRSEYSYIIECGDAKAPRYLCVNQLDAYIFWSYNAFDAIRFSRKMDAERFLALIPIADVEVRVVEHCFEGE